LGFWGACGAYKPFSGASGTEILTIAPENVFTKRKDFTLRFLFDFGPQNPKDCSRKHKVLTKRNDFALRFLFGFWGACGAYKPFPAEILRIAPEILRFLQNVRISHKS
jgi:hypothetical protein